MPEMVAVPSPLSVKVTPAGRGPVSVSDGAVICPELSGQLIYG
jgi:hypothetical protein